MACDALYSGCKDGVCNANDWAGDSGRGMRPAGVWSRAGRYRAAVQGQRHRRHHRLRAGDAIRRQADRGGALRALWQGRKIPRRASLLRRLHLVRLPLGALWRCRAAAEREVLSLTQSVIPIAGGRDMTRQLFSIAMLAAALPLCAAPALAVELPTRKAGLWELKMVRA